MLKDSAKFYNTRPSVKLGRGKALLTAQEKGSGPQIIAPNIESKMIWFYKYRQAKTRVSRIYSWRELERRVREGRFIYLILYYCIR